MCCVLLMENFSFTNLLGIIISFVVKDEIFLINFLICCCCCCCSCLQRVCRCFNCCTDACCCFCCCYRGATKFLIKSEKHLPTTTNKQLSLVDQKQQHPRRRQHFRLLVSLQSIIIRFSLFPNWSCNQQIRNTTTNTQATSNEWCSK